MSDLDELKTFLVEQDWKIYSQPEWQRENGDPGWYASKRTSSKIQCTCNYKPPSICIRPFSMAKYYDVYEAVTIELVAEDANDHWYELSCYSLPVEKVMAHLDAICDSLVRAWEAVNLK